MLNMLDIPLDDKKTWDLICSGKTKGVFQCEGYLPQTWLVEIQPRNIEELSDVISLIRPGCLKAVDENGISMTKHYSYRKSGKEEIQSTHPLIDDILEKTQGVITYQEQSLEIAKKLSNFSLEEADMLRYAIGKKKADKLRELKERFIEGAVDNGVKRIDAERIFENIQASQRYAFNKSIHPSTILTTKDGSFSTIKQIRIGQEVKTTLGYAKVINKHNHGNLETYKVTLENGISIKCSINHKFKTVLGDILPLWEILQHGYYILVQNQNPKDITCEYYKIKSIEYVGIMELWDLEVDSPDHIFYGNGIATSNSHAISYSYITYWTAYLKANYPLLFYKNWLKSAKEKIDPKEEIKLLISDANEFGYEILPPLYKDFRENFDICSDFCIRFGVLDVKYVGSRECEKLKILLKDNTENNWEYFLIKVLPEINKRSVESLISVGFFDGLKISRTEMLHQFDIIKKLSKTEFNQLNYDGPVVNQLKAIKVRQVRRQKVDDLIKVLENPCRSMSDNPLLFYKKEEDLLGTALTFKALDGVLGKDHATSSCKNFHNGFLAVVLDECKEILTKKKDTMAFLEVSDESGKLSLTCFPKEYDEFKNLLVKNNTLLIKANKSKQPGYSESVVVEKVIQI